MKYDDILLQCCGDCDNCAVYLECQYQTSSGDEKQKYLQLLTERDENLSANASSDAATSSEDLSERNDVEISDTEATDTAEVPNEEATDTEVTDKPDTEINDSDNASDIHKLQKAQAEEVKNDVTLTEEVVTQKEVLTSPDTQTVSNIYNEVFGITALAEEAEVITATETSEEVKAAEALQPQAQTKTLENKKANVVTPITDEAVAKIYNEVFNFDNINTQSDTVENADDVTLTEEVAVANRGDLEEPCLETAPVTEKEKYQDGRSTLQGAPRETVEQIYNEVFGLTLQNDEKAADTDNKTETHDPEVSEQATNKSEEVQTNQPDQSDKTEENQTLQEVLEQPTSTTVTEEQQEQQPQQEEPVKEKETFKLTPPENNEELLANMCAKRGRKLIYKPNEPILTASFKVLGTDKKNEIGEKVKDILDAEIKQGVKVGYLDKFEGLSSAEIKEEYENDIVYEFAEQEFKKTGVIYDGSKIKVYVYDWDGKACHHVGYVDANEAKDFIPYFTDKEKYSFDVCGIITGGKGKRVVKEGSSVKIIKEKGEPIGIDVDIVVLNRKD